MHEQADIVLLSPPFYRFMGSHNDKIPMSLIYLSAYLEDEDISHVVYNADYTGASLYWSLKWMCENYDTYVDAVDGKGSLYGEVIEQVLSFNPKMVVIMGGEPLVATAEWGNPFIAANYAKLLRQQGLYTIGMGPFFTLDQERFLPDFDCILGGEPSEAIVDVFHKRPAGMLSFGLNRLYIFPSLDHLFPAGQKTDWAMTSFGCPFNCSFCMNAALYGGLDDPVRYIDADTAARDLARRQEKNIYLADLNFPVASTERIQTLLEAFNNVSLDKTFTIDARVDCITKEKAELMKEIGITSVKLGVESLKQSNLDSWKKRITLQQTESAIQMLQQQNIDVIFYLLIDAGTTEDDYMATREFVEKWQPSFIVPNVHAYDMASDYRYDTEFSPLRLKELGIPRELYYRFLDLQSSANPTVGKIIG